jgi:hypothetical protein
MTDTAINEKINAAGLDFLHLQVLVNLYSLKNANRLEHLKEDLPVYFSKTWPECQKLLDELERADLIRKTQHSVELVEIIENPNDDHSCACG